MFHCVDAAFMVEDSSSKFASKTESAGRLQELVSSGVKSLSLAVSLSPV
jgi:hypothetical protein